MSYDFMSLEERMHFLVVTIAKKAFTHQEYNGQMIIGESEQLITEEYSISITMDVQVIDGEIIQPSQALIGEQSISKTFQLRKCMKGMRTKVRSKYFGHEEGFLCGAGRKYCWFFLTV